MAETNNVVKTDEFKSWKKPELQKWLRNHGLKVTGTKEELVIRVENAKRTGVNPNSSCTPAGSRARVLRGALYCCVPLCHSFKGKVVNGKPVKLHRLPSDLKLRRQWIIKLRSVRKNFVPKTGTRVCSLHFKGADGPKHWSRLPASFPSKPPPESPTLKRSLPDRSKGSSSKFGLKATKRLCLEKRFDGSGVTIYNSAKFEDSFHDYLPSNYCPGTLSKKIKLIPVRSSIQVQRTKISKLR